VFQGWNDPSLKWRFGASEIIGEQAAAEGAQQGTAAGLQRSPPFVWFCYDGRFCASDT